MSDECGRTAALAAGRTRKGTGEEGLVSWGCWGSCWMLLDHRPRAPSWLPSFPPGPWAEFGEGKHWGGAGRRPRGSLGGQEWRIPPGAWRSWDLNLERVSGGGGMRGDLQGVVRERRRKRRGLELSSTAPGGFLQVSPEGAGDEDSCSSSVPLSPSSSPRSMASGSVCPPGKCVCNSCGLEIVDKYLLKVGRS